MKMDVALKDNFATGYIKSLLLYSLLLSVISSFAAFFMQYLIDAVIPSGDLRFLFIFMISYLLYESFNMILTYLTARFRASLEKYLDYYYLDKYLLALITTRLSILNDYNKGGLIQRIYDAQNIKKYYLTLLIDIVVKLITILILSIIVLYVSPLVVSFLILGMIMLVIVYFLSVKKMIILEEQRFKIKSNFLSIMDDIIGGRETIRGNNYRNRILNRCVDRMNDFLNREKNVALLVAGVKSKTLTVNTIIGTVIRCVMVISIIRYSSFSLGIMLTLIAFTEMSLKHTMQILVSFMELKRSSITLERYKEFMGNNVVDESLLNTELDDNIVSVDEITVRNLHIGTNGNIVCKIPDFTFQSNKIYKIIGQNGIGKTTLCKTLIGLIPPVNGSVNFYVSDKTIKPEIHINQCSAYFPQDILFTTSIIENITLGRDVDRNKVESMLKKLNLWQTIDSLPEKLDTVISDKVNPFSEGQRQVLLFLRGYLSDKSVLIFDEIFRGIDNENAKVVSKLISEKEGCIIFYVAHDFTIDCENHEVLELKSEKDYDFFKLEAFNE
ncbi:ATP-binding cassette domain-containing protein [Photorhabdus laumondii subsp. laumondii]|uniref:ATP-binding cassette domain-containing protein n=2 Tax=Photorhabdus TaxID=29487 RepID=A0A6L9JS47_PHOLM|nr:MULTISPECIES: ABC transporter ATP-binding protein [Photorhabdus]AXG43795.1 ABC transporter ATP-binding protein [Photorhabdus laumondii subsp. laumondii]KTL61372.1 ABC transporter permease [Photorhabdus laumondii subsp. laumondii]MCC8415202.1 ABC transporter ATP-binding protein [Photorhabdus laumondii]MCZ1251609.1 ABC transporter ATP-binding protein [Photorhabdus laumondii subsp. laumondii]NDK96032.1 ATP-binding cassette domain-containing protein [Photorhabdus laumondii subsp. laumondii]